MSTFYEKIIKSVKTGFIKLVSTDPKTHMNFIVGSDLEDGWDKRAVTLTVERALQVRDALNEAYPPPKAEPEASDYSVRPSCGEWLVSRIVPVQSERTENVARCGSEDVAKKIAQALNEAEGL